MRFGGETRARRRRLPDVPRRGALAHGRERRRQVDADQGDHRRAPARRRDHPARRRAGALRDPARRAAARHQHGLPGDRPAAEPVGRREHRARPRAAPVRRDRLAADATRARARCSPTSGSTSTPRRSSARHSLAVQQLVAIARAISTDVKVLVLDEPTSSLDLDEVAELFRVIRELKQRGVAILFVSHFLDQVYEICDRVTVLRDGRLVGEYLTARAAAHRPRAEDARAQRRRGPRRRARAAGAPRDDATPFLERARRHRGAAASRDADVDLAEGEVLGVAGPARLGAHRARARADGGRPARRRASSGSRAARRLPRNPRTAISLGVVYSSENRRTEGIISELSVRENITLALQAQRGILRRIRTARQRELAASWIEALDIRPARPGPTRRHAVGRQPAEGAARAAARALAARARARRADPRHRRRREGRDPEPRRRARRQRPVGRVHLGRARGGAARRRPRRRPARRPRSSRRCPSEELTVDSLLALVARPDDDAS